MKFALGQTKLSVINGCRYERGSTVVVQLET